MSEYYDFSRASGISHTADYDSALAVQPMLADLIALRKNNQDVTRGEQQIRNSDLLYNLEKRKFDREVKDDEGFDNFTRQATDLFNQANGDPNAYAVGLSKLGMRPEFMGNKDVEESIRGVGSNLQASNTFRKTSMEARDITQDEAFEEDRRKVEAMNFAAAKMIAEGSVQRAEWANSNDDAVIRKGVQQTASAIYDRDPTAANAFIGHAQKLIDEKDFDSVRMLGEIGENYVHHDSYRILNSERFRDAGMIEQSLRKTLSGSGLDFDKYQQDPEMTAAIDAKLDAQFGSDPRKASEIERWRLARQDDAIFSKYDSAVKDYFKTGVANLSAEEISERRAKLSQIALNAVQMRKKYNTDLANKEVVIKNRENQQKLFNKHLDILKKQQDLKFGPQNQAFKQALIDMRRDKMDSERMAMVFKAVGAIDGKTIRNTDDLKKKIEEVIPLIDDDLGLESQSSLLNL